jgi:hypothetical protein
MNIERRALLACILPGLLAHYYSFRKVTGLVILSAAKDLLLRSHYGNFALALLAFGLLTQPGLTQSGSAQQPTVFQIEFTNVNLVPSHWQIKLNPDGSGQFDAEGGKPSGSDQKQIVVGDVHRPIQLSTQFTAHVFATARARRFFEFPCESHMNVAFQGTKRLSYSGPDGSGACEFNYSKDKQIQTLGEELMAVESTLLFGARLEKLLQHDRLGLDQEMEVLATAAHDGSAIEIGSIRETLTRIASDEQVLERARKKARLLLTQAR